MLRRVWALGLREAESMCDERIACAIALKRVAVRLHIPPMEDLKRVAHDRRRGRLWDLRRGDAVPVVRLRTCGVMCPSFAASAAPRMERAAL